MIQFSSRRTFLKAAATTTSTAVFAGCGSAEHNKSNALSGYPVELPEPLPKGLEYILTVRDFVRRILSEEQASLMHASDICAEAVANGNTLFYSIKGHNEPQCILETMPGKPGFLKALPQNDGHDKIAAGDVLITVRTNQCEPAKQKGARVIGIQMPFQPQKQQGQGIVYIDFDGPYMDDICDVTIWDRTPYTVGILAFDQLPWKSCSAHGAMDGIILGLILAGTIDRLVKRGIRVASVPGDVFTKEYEYDETNSDNNGKTLKERYESAVLGGFDTILSQFDFIRHAGKMLAEAKIAGGRWVLYDRGYAMSLDTSTRGSNPFANRMYRRQIKEFEPGDCLIMGSYFSDDPDDLTIATELRAVSDTKLVTVSPHHRPESPHSDDLLHEKADIAIDTDAAAGGGPFSVRGVSGPVLPYARDIMLTVNQAVVAEFIENMVMAGKPPTQFYLVHFPMFREIQEIMNRRVKKYGY